MRLTLIKTHFIEGYLFKESLRFSKQNKKVRLMLNNNKSEATKDNV